MEDLDTDEHIERLYERISEMSETLQKMLTAFLGSDTYGSRGYRHRIESNEESIVEHRKRMNKIEEKHTKQINELEMKQTKRMNTIDTRFDKVYQRVVGICVGVTICVSVVGWWVVNSTKVIQANPVPRIEQIPSAPPLSMPIPKINIKPIPEDSTDAG